MSVTRGGFLKACGYAAVAPVLGVDWLASVAEAAASNASVDAVATASVTIGDISNGRFRALIGQNFSIRRSTCCAAARLTEVAEGACDAQFTQFSLLFRSDRLLDEGTYRFTHAELGDFDLFIVPIGPRRAPFDYQACISRAAGL